MNTKRVLVLFIIFNIFSTFIRSQNFVTHNYSSVPGSDGYSAVGDMDGDGNIDIVTNSVDKMYIYYHDGTSPITIKSISIVPLSSYRARISLADMDGDGDLDILASRNNKLVIITNKSTAGKFLFEVVPLPIDFTTNYPHLLGADFDNDGKNDILVGDNSGRIKIYYQRVNTYIEYEVDFIQPAPIEANLAVLKIGDIDGDGKLDIVTGSIFSEKKALMVYFNEGNNFKPLEVFKEKNFRDIVLVDFDRDGDLDILSSGEKETFKYQIILWENNLKISNNFIPQTLIQRQNYFDAINVLDINNDNVYDVIAGLSSFASNLPGGLSVYVANDNQNALTFTEVKVEDFPSQTTLEAILLADFDNDGDQDFFHSTRNIWVENKYLSSSNLKESTVDVFSVYPNPSSDFFQFTIAKKVDLSIYNAKGDVLLRKDINPGDKIDISQIQQGLYFASITTHDGIMKTIPFVKK